MARHGWDAVGIDFVGRAIAKARRRARDAGASCTFVVGDVAALALPGPFDLALDIGCLHSMPETARAAYAAGVARVVRAGGTYLLYAFAPGGPAVGLTAEDVRVTFAGAFDVVGVEEGKGIPSAWYTLVRRNLLYVRPRSSVDRAAAFEAVCRAFESPRGRSSSPRVPTGGPVR